MLEKLFISGSGGEKNRGMANVKFSDEKVKEYYVCKEQGEVKDSKATPALSFRLGLQFDGALDKKQIKNCVYIGMK